MRVGTTGLKEKDMQTPAFAATKTVGMRKLSRGLIWVAAVMAASLCPALAFGQTNSTWDGGAGNWSTATDWTPNQVPNNGGGNTYNVIINSVSSEVTLNQNATISSLTLGSFSTLMEASGQPETLTVSGAITVSEFGSLWVNAGSTITAATVTNSGEVLVGISGNLSTLTVSGTFTNNGVLSVGTAEGVANIGSLVNNNGLVVYQGSTLNLTNQPNGITDISGSSAIQLMGTINAGSKNGLANLSSIEGVLDLWNGQSLTLAPSTLTVAFGARLNLAFGSSLTVTNLNDNMGAITLDNQSTLAVTNLGSLPDQSLININSGSKLLFNGSSVAFTGGGSVILHGGIITGSSTSDVLTNNCAEIKGFGTIGNNSLGLINQTLIIATGGVLTIDPGIAGFNNEGTLQVTSHSVLDITGATNSFSNFNATSGTLTGGTYLVLNGTLQFDGANIETNAAKIVLSGPQSQIINQTGGNGLANFATNTTSGIFTLMNDPNFSTSVAFSNAGKVLISQGSTFTVGGANSYTQKSGTTTDAGTLSVGSSGAVNVSGGALVDTGTVTTGRYTQTAGTTTVNGTLTAASGGVNVSGGSVFGIGTITGNIDLTGGLLSAGSASKKAGELTLKGTYTQSAAGAFDVDLGGTTAGTQYDVLNISGAATLGGMLNVDLISGFKPTVGETFDIMDYTSETGTFTALNLPKLTGGDTWSISYNATGVVLTVDGPAATQAAVSASPAKRVSRGLMAGAAADGMREPVAILSRATCFGARLPASATCGTERMAAAASGGERRATASAGTWSGAVHNNIMVATRSMSGGRGGAAGRESSASLTAMAKLYVCAYFPSSVAHTTGCN
jgi:hypothetical protein